MPRLGEVSRSENESPLVEMMYSMLFGDRDPVEEPGTNTGTPGDWWTVFARVPDVFQHAVDGFGLYQSPKRHLDPVLRELGQTRVGWAAGSQFVFSQHCKSMRGLGQSEERIAAIPHWQAADCFTEVERLVLAYTDALAYDLGRVPDGLFAKLEEHLSETEIIELTYITTLYLHHAVMSKALRTEYDDVSERIVEIRAQDTDGDVGLFIGPPE